jgi:hypothetical protein
MTIKYTHIFHCKTPPKFTQIGNFVLKIYHLATLVGDEFFAFPFAAWLSAITPDQVVEYGNKFSFSRVLFFKSYSCLKLLIIFTTDEGARNVEGLNILS